MRELKIKINLYKNDLKLLKKLRRKKIKYQDDFQKYGFVASETDSSLPQCLICLKTLSKESMNPSKLMSGAYNWSRD